MGRAPLDMRAILSEKKYAMPFIRMAITRAMVIPPRPPNACPTNNSSSVRAVSKNAVLRVFIVISLSWLGCAHFRGFTFEFHFAILCVGVHSHLVARLHLAVEDLERQRVLNQPLDRTLHRARSICRVVAFAKQKRLCCGREGKAHLFLGDTLHERCHLQLNDTLD